MAGLKIQIEKVVGGRGRIVQNSSDVHTAGVQSNYFSGICDLKGKKEVDVCCLN